MGSRDDDESRDDAPGGGSVDAERARAEARERRQRRRAEAGAPVRAEGAVAQEAGRTGFVQFVRECVAELQRVQWPDRRTLWQATAVVLVACIVVGAYLYALDSALKPIARWLIDLQVG